MRIDRRLTFFLLFYGCLLLIPLWQLSLLESTEARYGEIAREMLTSGNFLEPTLNGILHFHKPPLPYWCMAAGMAVFGVNDFGVRFFGIVAAILSLWFLYNTARIFFDDREQSFAVVLTLATSPLFIAISRVVSTDIYLTCCVIGAQFYLFRQVYGKRSTSNAIGYGLLLGLGFLVKGPVIFLFTLLPQLTAKLGDPQHRRLFGFRDMLYSLGCFLVVVLPWYVAVVLCHPDLLNYFVNVQTVDRLTTDRFNRNKPFWFFLVLFPATFLPYSFSFIRGVWRVRECPSRIRTLMIYVFLPLLVFCFSKSKLPTYILPFYGTAALLAVHSYRDLRSEWDDRFAFAVMMILAAGITFAGFVWPPLIALRWNLAFAGMVTLTICLISRRMVTTQWTQHVSPRIMLGISLILYLAVPYLQDEMKSYRPMVTKMNELDQQRQVPTLVYRGFIPSISFYRQNLATMALGKPREIMFEANYRYRRWYMQSDAEVKKILSEMPRVFVVTNPKHIKDFSSSMSFACSELYAQKRNTAYDCRQEVDSGKITLHIAPLARIITR